MKSSEVRTILAIVIITWESPDRDAIGEPLMKRLVSEIDLATILGVCPRTIRNWRAQRLFPFFKIGAAVRYDPDSVLSALRKFERLPREVGK